MYAKVEGTTLNRDMTSKAIIETDFDKYQLYKRNKAERVKYSQLEDRLKLLESIILNQYHAKI